MRFVKWTVVFAIAFVFAWVVIYTFSQEPFAVQVSARIFTYSTPAIPVYWYVAGSLALGLFLGLLMTAYASIASGLTLRRVRKEVFRLEQEIARLRSEAQTHTVPALESIAPPGNTPAADITTDGIAKSSDVSLEH